MDKIKELIKYIKESKKTVVFTGAGVSTPSGLQDFRSKDGIYQEIWDYPPEEILSHSFFVNNTDYFYDFYKKKLNSLNYKPNIIHETLKKMQDKNLLSSVITQNIDGFDIEAGINNVLELHGSVHRNYCLNCHKFYDGKKVFNSKGIPKCSCGGTIKPDVVLYEEPLDDNITARAILEIGSCDLLIICGTSLQVYPAAFYVNYFRGKHMVLINRSKTPYDNKADLVIYDELDKVFQEINNNL